MPSFSPRLTARLLTMVAFFLTTTTASSRWLMPSTTHKDGRNAALYAPLKRRMVENGDWDRCVLRVPGD
ncbi:hypothetical protein BN946_scf184761.g13 [Trametes cinnabarina]|uniref:Secreted protein n=1 Tax=Pycnoporus cinnabarinus TaxID=5643 RepID=A0A060S8J1_PYCCI|nr:hypothetical protein BN946_scf184761.g13 [Trametes cinnabarina]